MLALRLLESATDTCQLSTGVYTHLPKGEGGGGKKEKISVGIDPWFSQKIEIFKKSPF
jgi:hypothetical protein